MTGLRASVEVPGPFAPNPVIAAGDGSPVLYLHGPFGQEWPGFLDDLSTVHRVYAPASPGIADTSDLSELDGFPDLVLYYEDLLDELGVEQVDLVGHSFGGMVAAEMAATLRRRIRRLVLIDPMGLWIDDVPVQDHLLVSQERQQELLFHDREAPEVAQRLQPPDDLVEARGRMLDTFDALGATAHFIHPIPERGLSRRLRRITADTLLVWGEQDLLVPPTYAEAFRAGIADAEVELVPGAGHHPHLERREHVSRRTIEFLAA